jgi:uncharacterized membrane protein
VESEQKVPPQSAVAATPSGTQPTAAADTGGIGTSANAPDASPAAEPVEPIAPADEDAQETVHDLRREAHLDAGAEQSTRPPTAPAWHVPSAPPYVPPPALRPPPQPPTHVPWRAAQSWGPTTFSISAETAAGFSYLFWWLSGLIVYFAERNNRYVRFHALQSILLSSAFTVFGVVAYVFDALFNDLTRATHWTVFGALGNGVAVLAGVLGIVVPWLWTMIAAWTGHDIRWPIVGAYAERYAAPPLQTTGTPY